MSTAWTALADPTRRTIVERLAARDHTAGELGAGLRISQPAVSKHLRVLREAELVTVEPLGQRRIYRLRPEALDEIDDWAREVRDFWRQRLDALDTEIARGRRDPHPAQPTERTDDEP